MRSRRCRSVPRQDGHDQHVRERAQLARHEVQCEPGSARGRRGQKSRRLAQARRGSQASRQVRSYGPSKPTIHIATRNQCLFLRIYTKIDTYQASQNDSVFATVCMMSKSTSLFLFSPKYPRLFEKNDNGIFSVNEEYTY